MCGAPGLARSSQTLRGPKRSGDYCSTEIGVIRMAAISKVLPQWMREYKPSWLSADLIAGVTLAAIAVPEVMGYTSIAQTPVITGLYTIIFPTLLFALLGSSRLL